MGWRSALLVALFSCTLLCAASCVAVAHLFTSGELSSEHFWSAAIAGAILGFVAGVVLGPLSLLARPSLRVWVVTVGSVYCAVAVGLFATFAFPLVAARMASS